jgi:hypothetical protein
MLAPRLSLVRLVRWWATGSLVGLITFAGAGGCQGPDTFLRNDGSGGSPKGGSNGQLGGFTGGGLGGAGGSNLGLGGAGGAGGLGSGGSGAGGTTGAGGAGTGGRTGTGGNGAGGSSPGGRSGTDGGVDAPGAGGIIGTGGAPGMDGGSDVPIGNGPCAGLCTVSSPLDGGAMPGMTQLGLLPSCQETTANVHFVVCGNFTTKTFSVNGTLIPCVVSSATFPLPTTKLNGGYCFQSTAGAESFAYFSTYF